MSLKDISELFTPYQKNWLRDESRYKMAAKSRRTGFTWTQAFEDVKDATTKKVRGKKMDVWFSSSNFDNALEYILYCKDFASTLNAGFVDLGIEFIDEKAGIKAHSIEFNNGARITGLSSNPKVLRGKGGKLVLDEFAFHDDPVELWKAAKPVVTWGFPLRIISSLNGKNLFYQFAERIKQGKLNWALHEIDIFKAVEMGLVDKILDHKATEEEKRAWIEEERRNCGDETTWQQEYCCVAVDEASSFISYDLINSCVEYSVLYEHLSQIQGDFYVGYDVARKKDLSVISIFEKLGNIFYLRKIYELKNVSFHDQKTLMFAILMHPKCRRCAIDDTGIGKQMAEELKEQFGSRLVEPVTFTLKVKEELAYKLLYAFQDRNIRIPDEQKIKDDIHSIKRVPTEANVVRFDVARSETDGHADRFWSFALAIYAGTNEPYQKPIILHAKANLYKGLNSELNLNGIGGLLKGMY